MSGKNTLAFQVHNYKKTNADFIFLAELSAANVRHTVTGLSPSQTYYYVMRASDGSNNKNTNTTVKSGKPLLAPPPSPVAGLTAVKSGTTITPHHYNIYRGNLATFVPDIAHHANLLGTATSATYTDVGALGNSTNYFYRLTAVTPTGRELRVLGLGSRVASGRWSVTW